MSQSVKKWNCQKCRLEPFGTVQSNWLQNVLFYVVLVLSGSVETPLGWSCKFCNSSVEYSFLFNWYKKCNKKLSYRLETGRQQCISFVAKLLSIAVMTYSYVYHLRNLRPANLLRTQRINFSMRPQHVRMTRDPIVVWCLLSRELLRIPA